jgi:hypothetical protein
MREQRQMQEQRQKQMRGFFAPLRMTSSYFFMTHSLLYDRLFTL